MKLWIYFLGAGTIELAAQFRKKLLMCARNQGPTNSDKRNRFHWDSVEPAALSNDLRI